LNELDIDDTGSNRAAKEHLDF